MLEKRINIRASDYRFDDKKKYYEGFTNTKGQAKEGTAIIELLGLTSSSTDFTEADIVNRYNEMMKSFIGYLKTNDLLQQDFSRRKKVIVSCILTMNYVK